MNSFRKISRSDRFKGSIEAGPRGSSKKVVMHEEPRPTPGSKPADTEIKIHKISGLDVDLEPDRGIFKTIFGIGRLLNDDYDSLSAYMSEMLKFFEGAKRCSIYLGAKREISGRKRTILEHHITIRTNGGVRTESLEKNEPIINRNNPVLRSYNQKKPRLIDYREGMEIIFKNLDRENDRCDVYSVNNGLFKEAVAVVPFYYREKHRPYGVILIEGDLRCRGSEKEGLSKVYYSTKAAVLAGMQTAFVFTQKFDWTTRFPRKQDFEIDFEKSIRKLRKKKSKNGSESTFFILVDLDEFKSVNETYGYLAGDVVLRMAATEIENSVRVANKNREGDKYFRWGGEEFAILAENISLEGVFVIAERIRKRMEEMKAEVGDEEISVTCSIGLVDMATILNSKKDASPKSVFDKCDRLLKYAKRSGRNRIAFYNENGKPKFLNEG